MIRIEDEVSDVLAKAMIGRGISKDELSRRAGLTAEQVGTLLAGNLGDLAAVRRAANSLGLNERALLELADGGKAEDVGTIEGLHGFDSAAPHPNYQEMRVNGYLVWDLDTKQAALFDAGMDASELQPVVDHHGLDLQAIYLTHTHGDHVQRLGEIRAAYPSIPVYVHEDEALPEAELIREGRTFELGKLRIEVRRTSGHSAGGVTYVITGLERTLAIVGDALFCYSIGRVNVGFEQAMEQIRRNILSLPEDAVLCPGHGPLTTAGFERSHNPFFAS